MMKKAMERESCGQPKKSWKKWAQYTVMQSWSFANNDRTINDQGTVDRLAELITMLATDNDGQEGKECKNGKE